MKQKFTLLPFRPDVKSGIAITGAIERLSNSLSLSYTLSGPLAEIEIPDTAEVPERRDRLWEETCMEFFVGPKDHANYWEFNIAPAGHWNIYCFADYRAGMGEEQAFTSMPVIIRKTSDAIKLSFQLALDPIIPADKAVNIGITAVIKHLHDGNTYWALVHPGAEPDFHRRDGFLIEL